MRQKQKKGRQKEMAKHSYRGYIGLWYADTIATNSTEARKNIAHKYNNGGHNTRNRTITQLMKAIELKKDY